MDETDVEYVFEKGKGWVACLKGPKHVEYYYIPGWGIQPGTILQGSNGIVGRVISYKNGIATIELMNTIEYITIQGTITI